MTGTAPLAVSEAELPFLVVHGGAVWWLIVLAAGIAGAALAIVAARRAMTVRGRAALAELRELLIAPDALRDGARVALRGRLVGPPGAAAVGLRLHGRDAGGGHHRTGTSARSQPELALELLTATGAPPRRVALDGPICVVAGAEVVAGHGRDIALIAPLPDEALALARQAAWTQSAAAPGGVGVLFTEMHRVPVGTAVLVSGQLVLGPAARAGAAGYRDAAERWTMIGSEADPIRLACERPGMPSLAASRWGRGFLLGASLITAILGVTGQLLVRAANGTDRRADVALDPGDPLVIAAALPGSRDRALELLRRGLHRDTHRDAGAVARLAALDRMVGGCGDEVDTWAGHRQFEVAAQRAAACGDSARAARALGELGDYRAAADHAARFLADGRLPGDDVLVALIANHRFAEAARAALLLRDRNVRALTSAPELAPRVMAYECLARHLEVRSGQRAGMAALSALARQGDGRVCGILYADLLSGAELDDYLALWRVLPAPTGHRDASADAGGAGAIALLEVLGGAHLRSWRAIADAGLASALARPTARLSNADRIALPMVRPLRAALASRQERTELEERALADLRAADVALDALEDPARGKRQLEQLVRSPRLERLMEAIELRSGESDLPAGDSSRGPRFPATAYRLGQRPQEVELQVAGGDPVEVDRALIQAAAGDGRPLADLLQRHESRFIESVLLGVAPRLQQGREALAEHLRWRRAGLPIDRDPCDRMVRAAIMRDLSRWLGDSAQTQRWAAVFGRQQKVCLDRDSALALWMVRLLPP